MFVEPNSAIKSTLLAGTGRSATRLASSDRPVSALAASNSGAAAVTVTVSACAPTCSASGRFRVSPTRNSNGPCSYFLNPATLIERRYWPGIRFGNSKFPFDVVLAELTTFVPRFTHSTAAFGTMAPEESATRPIMRPPKGFCASNKVLSKRPATPDLKINEKYESTMIILHSQRLQFPLPPRDTHHVRLFQPCSRQKRANNNHIPAPEPHLPPARPHN